MMDDERMYTGGALRMTCHGTLSFLIGSAGGAALACLLFPAMFAGTDVAADLTRLMVVVALGAALAAITVTGISSGRWRMRRAGQALVFGVLLGLGGLVAYFSSGGVWRPWFCVAPVVALSAACFAASVHKGARNSANSRWAGVAAGVTSAYAFLDLAGSLWVASTVALVLFCMLIWECMRLRRASAEHGEFTLGAGAVALCLAAVVHALVFATRSWTLLPLYFCMAVVLTAGTAAALTARCAVPLPAGNVIKEQGSNRGPAWVKRAQQLGLRVVHPAEALALGWGVLLLLTFAWNQPAFVDAPTAAYPANALYVPPPAAPDPTLALYGLDVEAAAADYSHRWDEYNYAVFEDQLEQQRARSIARLCSAHNDDVRATIWIRRTIKLAAWVALVLLTAWVNGATCKTAPSEAG